jgi:hypothetical protein
LSLAKAASPGNGRGEEALILKFTEQELAVVQELSEYHQLSTLQTMRQALRLYQLHERRIKDGETITWSGDKARAQEFAALARPVDAGMLANKIHDACPHNLGFDNYEIGPIGCAIVAKGLECVCEHVHMHAIRADRPDAPLRCQCEACQRDQFPHASDCAVHNGPALPVGACTCRAAQASPDHLGFIDAMSLAERGLEIWKAKEHNAKWWRKIDGTPIPNDLLVNIAEEFAKCGLVYASSVPSAWDSDRCGHCAGKGYLVVSELTDDNCEEAIPIPDAVGTPPDHK